MKFGNFKKVREISRIRPGKKFSDTKDAKLIVMLKIYWKEEKFRLIKKSRNLMKIRPLLKNTLEINPISINSVIWRICSLICKLILKIVINDIVEKKSNLCLKIILKIFKRELESVKFWIFNKNWKKSKNEKNRKFKKFLWKIWNWRISIKRA